MDKVPHYPKIHLAEVEKDIVGTKYMKRENSVCFSDLCIFVVELPVSEHGRPEVMEAKMKEIQNLEEYKMFEEVCDEGQETIRSR